MRRGLLLFLIGWMGFGLTLCGQTLEFPGSPVVFYSPSKNAYQVIWQDSLFFSKGKGQPWQSTPIYYGNDLDYASLKNEYIPISTSKGDYFVVGGCGLVYALKGDSIVRIDHSFRHKNQNGGLYWVHNDTLYITGGYGYFEATNITTYFDWDTKGWYHRKCNGDVPPAFSGGVAFRGKERSFYFYGRGEGIHGGADVKLIRLLDHVHWKWRDLGEMALPWNPNNEPVLHFWKNRGTLARIGNNMIDVDEDNNSAAIYKSDKFAIVQEIVQVDHQLLLSRPDHQLSKFIVEVVDKQEFLGKPIDQVVLVPAIQTRWWLVLVALVFLVVVLFLWFWFLQKAKQSSQVMALTVHSFKDQFSKLELELMDYFFEVGENGFESADLNRFFDHGSPNFDTLKKRRDLKMREMRKRLALITGIPAEEIFLEKRLDSDRRVKKLYLNPRIKRENTGISS